MARRSIIVGTALAVFTATTWALSAADAPGARAAGVWHLDEGAGNVAGDVSGNGADGAVIGAAWAANGGYGSALRFDGEDDCAEIPLIDSLNAALYKGKDAMTVEAWVRPFAVHGDPYFIDGQGWALAINRSTGRFYFIDTHRWSSCAAKTVPEPNRWYHVAGVWEGRERRIYVNGVEEGSFTGETRFHQNKPITLGAIGGTSRSNFFFGMLDEVKVYGNALSAAEIAASYSRGAAAVDRNIPQVYPTFVPDLLQLAKDGKSEYIVVIAADAEEPVPAAAGEFIHFFKEITGVELPIVTDAEPMQEHEIIIGPSRHLADLAVCIDWDKLGNEGYVIRTSGRHLLLFGGPTRGTINAVYTFLEDYLGCRWYTSTCSVIPEQPDLSIDLIHVEAVPAFEARAMSCANGSDAAWAARQRINSFNSSTMWGLSPSNFTGVKAFMSEPRLAKCLKFVTSTTGYKGGYAPTWLHTLAEDRLLPSSYFEEHPEYFGLDADGKRNVEITPCLIHPEVFRIVMANAGSWMENLPGANILSISQADQPMHDYCHCMRCREAGNKYSYRVTRNPLGHFPYGDLSGWNWTDPTLIRPAFDLAGQFHRSYISPTGVLLEFCNRVAEGFEQDYPDMLIHTLAYYWTKYPPDGIRLHPNVTVDFAPLNACRYHTLCECSSNEAYKGLWTAVRRWRKLTPHTWVWRYDQGGTYEPRPTLRYLDLYFRELKQAGVSGVYMFTYEFDRRSWLNGLRTYLFAKLLWNPDYYVTKGMQEYINAYYGDAAPEVLTYVLETQEANSYVGTVDKALQRFPGYHTLGGNAIKPESIKRWDRLLAAAEEKVRGDRMYLERLMTARLPVLFCAMRDLSPNDAFRAKAREEFARAGAAAGLSEESIKQTIASTEAKK